MSSVTGRARVWNALTNWRLLLLGATGVVLSLASGWTTWDGMRNFTNEPVLSLMITFGIQGVMLIVAWLIGETFATGMGRRNLRRSTPDGKPGGSDRLKRLRLIIFAFLFLCVIGALCSVLLYRLGILSGNFSTSLLGSSAGKTAMGIVGLLALALVLLSAGRNVFERYAQTGRIVFRHLALWLMFLSCMAASVFFSFDSLFTTIFPADERSRAAQLRARSQVSVLVATMSDTTAQRRLEERAALLSKAEWRSYSKTLDQLGVDLRGAVPTLDAKLSEIENARRKSEADRKGKLSAIENERDRLETRAEEIDEEIEIAREQAVELKNDVNRLNKQIFAKDREVIAKGAEAEAEAKGIGATARRGRGPRYRAIVAELRRLQAQKSNLLSQLRKFRSSAKKTRGTLARLEAEKIDITQRIAALPEEPEQSGKALKAAKRIESAKTLKRDVETQLVAMEKQRVAFVQEPTRERLDALQARCIAIVERIGNASDVKTELTRASCDPGPAHVAAAPLYALNTGADRLASQCIGPNKLPKSDALETQVTFARECLQTSGLASAASAPIRFDINALERDRDDKAHRFVVSINAFTDGNRLAYLALAIALAIDALVFVSGLFGANAVRSRLSDIPNGEGRTAQQLESLVESALLPDVYRNSTLTLEAARPLDTRSLNSPGAGWTHEIELDDAHSLTARRALRKLLNAGMTIGAVQRDPVGGEAYFLRSELIEFLNQTAGQAYGRQGSKADASAIYDALTVALRPAPAQQIETVLRYVQPSSEKADYTCQIVMSGLKKRHRVLVERCLNAGASERLVLCVGKPHAFDRFLLHKDFYRALVSMAEGLPTERVAQDETLARSGSTAEQVTDESYLPEPPNLTNEAAAIGQSSNLAEPSSMQTSGKMELPLLMPTEVGRTLPETTRREADPGQSPPGADDKTEIVPQRLEQPEGHDGGAGREIASSIRKAGKTVDRPRVRRRLRRHDEERSLDAANSPETLQGSSQSTDRLAGKTQHEPVLPGKKKAGSSTNGGSETARSPIRQDGQSKKPAERILTQETATTPSSQPELSEKATTVGDDLLRNLLEDDKISFD